MTAPPARLLDALAAIGVIDADDLPVMVPLTGGVSSDIWRLDLPDGAVVAKQALPRLRVAGRWEVPTARTRYEAAWLRRAASIRPDVVPHVIAASADVIVMEYLDPRSYPVWKSELLAGRVDVDVADALGRRLVAVHAATAHDPAIAEEFDSATLFRALRLDPYFQASAAVHRDLGRHLDDLCRSLEANALALVHGDVSPKNVLAGPGGPLLVDAECATWGDPAFDVAFCATHLLLKRLVVPEAHRSMAAALERFVTAYEAGVTWESPAAFERRVASTTAGLLLARVDGLSPVEYLDEQRRQVVRAAARQLLVSTPATLADLSARWDALTGVPTRA